jgi:hypothetical protein
MAAPLDATAQNIVLDALLGDGAAAGMPTVFELAIFDGDPRGSGVELPATGGYARVVGITNASVNFPDAVDAMKTMAAQAFADSTGAWPNVGTWWVLFDGADSTTRYHFGLLDEPVVVPGAVSSVLVRPRIYWNPQS